MLDFFGIFLCVEFLSLFSFLFIIYFILFYFIIILFFIFFFWGGVLPTVFALNKPEDWCGDSRYSCQKQ